VNAVLNRPYGVKPQYGYTIPLEGHRSRSHYKDCWKQKNRPRQNYSRIRHNQTATERVIFTTELPITPAFIPPFLLVVDDSRWEHNRNRGPPRPQTTSNNADIVRQIAILEKQGIIEMSTAVYNSQVLMVPKPDGSKRLCVDYRPLNKCTPNPSWPLHEIKESYRCSKA
jgi:hypothetical protein